MPITLECRRNESCADPVTVKSMSQLFSECMKKWKTNINSDVENSSSSGGLTDATCGCVAIPRKNDVIRFAKQQKCIQSCAFRICTACLGDKLYIQRNHCLQTSSQFRLCENNKHATGNHVVTGRANTLYPEVFKFDCMLSWLRFSWSFSVSGTLERGVVLRKASRITGVYEHRQKSSLRGSFRHGLDLVHRRQFFPLAKSQIRVFHSITNHCTESCLGFVFLPLKENA
jgi:hypothetical protein